MEIMTRLGVEIKYTMVHTIKVLTKTQARTTTIVSTIFYSRIITTEEPGVQERNIEAKYLGMFLRNEFWWISWIWFSQRGWKYFISLEKNISPTTPSSSLVVHIFSSLPPFSTQQLSRPTTFIFLVFHKESHRLEVVGWIEAVCSNIRGNNKVSARRKDFAQRKGNILPAVRGNVKWRGALLKLSFLD